MKANHPKRVLYIEQNTDGTVGGSHFSLLFLVEGLDKKTFAPCVAFYQEHPLIQRYRQAGCEVMLLKKPEPSDFLKSFPTLRRLAQNGFSRALVVWPALLLQKAANCLRTFILPSFECWRIIQKGGFDLVHLNNTVLRPQQWILASKLAGAKIVAHERGINKKFPAAAFYIAKSLDAIICISDAVKSNLIRNGFPAEKLFRIYNGLDPGKFRVSRPKEEVLKELGVCPSYPIIGIVGNIKEWKGQEVVIRSMRAVLESLPDAKCLIVGGVSPGDMEYQGHIERLISSEGLTGSVIVTGYRKDVPDIINCLDVLVHASIEPEPFGRVLLEGMALEKPVISNTIGSGPEIVVDGVTGLLVPPRDEKSLAAAVISIVKDAKKAARMGKAGRMRVEELFHISENVKMTEQLYRKII